MAFPAIAESAASTEVASKATKQIKKVGKRLSKLPSKLPLGIPSKLPTIENGKLTKVSTKDAQRTIVVGLLAITALHLGLSGKLTSLIKLAQ